jgi:hypothetical protein
MRLACVYNVDTPGGRQGPVSYLSHQAEMPMQITWKLNHSLPADLFIAYRAAAA